MLTALRFYAVVATTGAVIMALEIISSRVLAPSFGNSVYVWGSIISVFLAALSVGYYLGGRLADRQPRLANLGRLILAGAVCEVVLLFAGTRLAEVFGGWTGSSPGGTLLAATVLFGPPSLFLATVSPFAVRLAARDLAHLGNTAGRLFALSTAGSLVGTLGCTFLLIPYLRLQQTLGLLLLATVLTGCLAVAGEWRRELAALGLAAALAVAAVTGMVSRPARAEGVLFVKVTPYQTLHIRESGSQRFMLGDRTLYSAVDMETGEATLPVLRYAPAALLLKQDIESLLVLGMGGGSIGKHLRAGLGEIEVDYVDIDPAVAELAERFLGFEAGPGERVHVDDARQFLRRSQRRWDYIFGDAYIGLSVPFHLTTTEFFAEVKRRLEPGGVFGLNLAGGLEDPFSRAIFHTVSESFLTTYAFGVRGAANVVLLAIDQKLTLPKQQMLQRGQELDRRWRFDPTLTLIASSRLDVTLDPAEAVLLTDAFAPASHLIMLGAGSGERTLEELLGTSGALPGGG